MKLSRSLVDFCHRKFLDLQYNPERDECYGEMIDVADLHMGQVMPLVSISTGFFGAPILVSDASMFMQICESLLKLHDDEDFAKIEFAVVCVGYFNVSSGDIYVPKVFRECMNMTEILDLQEVS